MKSIATTLLLLWVILPSPNAVSQNLIPDSIEFRVLKDIYDSLGGPGWTNKTGWPVAGSWPSSASASQMDTWYGITVTNNDISMVSLAINGLTGTIPSSVGNLTSLTQLHLNNNNISGKMPATIGNLINLQQLRLHVNQLNGAIPASLGNLINLQYLYLYTNKLSGSIPIELTNLTNLEYLRLETNQLTGEIPSTLGNLTKLKHLYLGANQLSGSIPAGIGNITSLTHFYAYNNQLTGSLPSSIGNLSKLVVLQLYGNQLNGSLPDELGNLALLTHLQIYGNRFTGQIPQTLGGLTSLLVLNISSNQLSGSIPVTICQLPNLQQLSLSVNQLTGEVLPELGNLSKLQYLYLDHNQMSGLIPAQLGNLSNLLYLKLEVNQLTGGIPTEIGNLSKLLYLGLAANKLTGSIPMSLGNLSSLTHMYIYGNQLTGEIPSSIGNLSKLVVAQLYSNQLSGSIPVEIGNLSSLNSLFLYNNHLSGTLPSELGNLSKLITCQLQNNKLSGIIPAAIGNLLLLEALYLNDNKLEGEIPASFCSLPKIKSIYLNGNYLKGIPNFYSHVNKANLDLRLQNNFLTFSDLEPTFNLQPHGIKTFVFSPQRKFNDVVKVHVPANSELNIEAADPGLYSTITWEKKTGGVWQNVNAQSEDVSLKTFKITNPTTLANGFYRWRMTNSKVTGLTLESEQIEVEIVDALPASVATDALYNGVITSVRWRIDEAYGTGGGEFKGMYTFKYDDRYQLKEANWADPLNLSMSNNNFRVTGLNYDPNGNILALKRYDGDGFRINNFTYQYNSVATSLRTNQLEAIAGYATYDYDLVGRMTQALKANSEADDQFVEYDVAGKVRKVFKDAAKTQLKVEFLYDDRGFRLAKVNLEPGSLRTTWYIRDASGKLISTYEQEGIISYNGQTPALKTEPLDQTEVPIYGSGKVAMFYPGQDGSTAYEITDHLGNVRALVRENIGIYTATMEDNGYPEDITNPRFEESHYYVNLEETQKKDIRFNHTHTVPGDSYVPAWSAYLHWQDGTEAANKSVGPATMVRVNAGDEIDIETWVRYEINSANARLDLVLLSQFLGTDFVNIGGFEGYTVGQTSNALQQALTSAGYLDGADPARPFAYLNYILFDENMVPVPGGSKFKQVPIEAGFEPGEEHLEDMHAKLSFDAPVIPEQTGFLYIWVSNESENTKVWFDDLKVTHTMSAVVSQATDYGVWGDVLREQKTDPTVFYKYGYQGQFSEADPETGWNHFELREYDPIIGRWTSADPYNQFPSPYIGMGNNPVNAIDPTGGTCFDANGKPMACPPGFNDFSVPGTDISFADAVEFIDNAWSKHDQSMFSWLEGLFGKLPKGDGIAYFSSKGGGPAFNPRSGTATHFITDPADMAIVFGKMNEWLRESWPKGGPIPSRKLIRALHGILSTAKDATDAYQKLENLDKTLLRELRELIHGKVHTKEEMVKAWIDTLSYPRSSDTGNHGHKYSGDSSYHYYNVWEKGDPKKLYWTDTLKFNKR